MVDTTENWGDFGAEAGQLRELTIRGRRAAPPLPRNLSGCSPFCVTPAEGENAAMSKFGLSQPERGKEDVRFLNGTGRYVDDIAPEGALFAVFLRATMAHGEIAALVASAARAADGVRLMPTGADLDIENIQGAMSST